MMDVTVGALRGMGKAIAPTVVSIIGSCGLRLVWIYTVFAVHSTPDVLYLSFPLAWFFTFLALLVTIVASILKEKKRFAAEKRAF